MRVRTKMPHHCILQIWDFNTRRCSVLCLVRGSIYVFETQLVSPDGRLCHVQLLSHIKQSLHAQLDTNDAHVHDFVQFEVQLQAWAPECCTMLMTLTFQCVSWCNVQSVCLVV